MMSYELATAHACLIAVLTGHDPAHLADFMGYVGYRRNALLARSFLRTEPAWDDEGTPLF